MLRLMYGISVYAALPEKKTKLWRKSTEGARAAIEEASGTLPRSGPLAPGDTEAF
jgi:hypothetical protein